MSLTRHRETKETLERCPTNFSLSLTAQGWNPRQSKDCRTFSGEK
jgi:hypothetical protein